MKPRSPRRKAWAFFVEDPVRECRALQSNTPMERMVFESRLREATGHAVQFAREFVLQTLPEDIAFRVYPNRSADGHPHVGDEEVFPCEWLPFGKFHGPWSVERVVKYLWRNGKVPEWIDIGVEAVEDHRTILYLQCCGRFTAMDELLYYPDRATSPLAVKSPILPPFWTSVEESGRFDLNRCPKIKW